MDCIGLYLLAISLVATVINSHQHDCSRLEYDRCVKIADPLVKEAHLVFPDNLDDIDLVCRTWNKFVDCLKRYTDICFTDQQRRQFNKAVENPIESVHQMCMQPQYQKEYLQYAPCIKSTITEKNHCGPHYQLLVEQVAQGEIISKATLCCSHDRFKQCVQRETRRLCDRGAQGGPAATFSAQILDKALSFLGDQCFNYIPNSGDCGAAEPSTYPDHVMISTAPSEVYPWSTIQEANNVAPKEMPPSKSVPPKPSTTWLPSSPPSPIPHENNFQTDPSTQILGSRTRPASYGRSSSWSDTPPQVSSTAGTNGYGAPGTEEQLYQSSSSSPRPDWATISTWNVINNNNAAPVNSNNNNNRNAPGVVETSPEMEKKTNPQTQTPETWYPAAGNQLSNEVDEPNQQGLSYNGNNGAEGKSKRLISLTLVTATVLTAIC